MDLNPAKHRELLQQAPILAGLSVGRCETGLIQDALETLALIHQLEDAKRQYPNHRWIAGLFEDRDAIRRTVEHWSDVTEEAAALSQQMHVSFRSALAFLDENALPSEIEEYKQFVLACGTKVAAAAGGGPFGVSSNISPTEAECLQEIRSSLGLDGSVVSMAQDLNEKVPLSQLVGVLFGSDHWVKTLSGIAFVTVFSLAAYQIATASWLQNLRISPLIIGILVGAFYTNTVGHSLPDEWRPGISFCAKKILRLAIIFYGVRVSIQDFMSVGLSGALASLLVVVTTFSLGLFIGQRVLRLDRDVTILTAAGSSICGAAAVLAVEGAIGAKSYKSAIAIGTVVLFGTTGMFLYPLLFNSSLLPFDQASMGIYIGSSLHEVAHVAAAGQAISEQVSNNAVIVKMIRVLLLVPLLLWLGQRSALKSSQTNGVLGDSAVTTPGKVMIPWFAILFLLVIVLNSLLKPSAALVGTINTLDTFALTMAMTALGLETNVDKFKSVGLKPIYLGFILFIWLIFGGGFIVNMLT